MSRPTLTLLRRGAAIVVLAAVFAPPLVRGAAAQAVAVHGADAVFVSPDVGIVWAVLKEPASDKATVWLRIVSLSQQFSHLSIDGVDPFSKQRQRLAAGLLLKAEARVPADRAGFSELPSRELHFYRSEAEWKADQPALTVFYLGVPDTTPEFLSRAQLDGYLSTARLDSRRK